MQASRKIQAVCLLLAAVLVAVGSLHTKPINDQRRELHIGFHEDPTEDLPLSLKFAVTSLGTFRAFAIDYLWIKAIKLKEENKHFLSMQHAKWICALQPRFASVWVFQAWEMAFNISVTVHTPEERWTWVYNGITLLRAEGIPLNPGSLKLYKELGWIYFFKMGDVTDEMHWAYKCEWAALMQRVVGSPPAGASATQAIDAFRVIAASPRKLEDLIEADPRIGAYVDKLRAAGIELGYPLLDALSSIDTMTDLPLAPTGTDGDTATASTPDVPTVPDDDANGAVRDKLAAYVRADILRNEFSLDPDWMIQLMEKYGPLDWRSPFSHALYWNTLGNRSISNLSWRNDIETLNNNRFIQFGLNRLMHSGRLTFELNHEHPNQSYYSEAPDIRFIEPLHQVYIELGKLPTGGKGLDKNKKTQSEYFRTGHNGFLTDAIRLLYRYGTDAQIAQARKYYKYLRLTFRNLDGTPKARYLVPFEDFALAEIEQDITRPKIATSMINADLEFSFANLARGDVDLYHGQQRTARRMYEIYMKDKGDDPTPRRRLPPWPKLLKDNLWKFLTVSTATLSSVRPPRGASSGSEVVLRIRGQQAQQTIRAKARVWHHLGTLGDDEVTNRANRILRQSVYDSMLPTVTAQCELAGFDVAKAFPEPVGMAAYREKNPKPRGATKTQTQPATTR